MEAKDLRIGNLITDQFGEITEVSEINDIEVHSKIIGDIPLDCCLPIPLTEEWLLKFVFEKCEGRHGIYYKHKVQELFRVWKCLPDYWGVGRKDLDSKDREYNTHWVSLNIQHVHQLQNLYFTLTGEELEVKQEIENL